MFDPITDPMVGTTRLFMPPGYSPYRCDEEAVPLHPDLILVTGDAVVVEGAFTRPYMARTAPTLYYVRSLRTGKATHVTAAEINLELPLKATKPIFKLDALKRATRFPETPYVNPTLIPRLEAIMDARLGPELAAINRANTRRSRV